VTYCQLWAFGLYNSILLDLPLKREKTLVPMYRTAMMIRGKKSLKDLEHKAYTTANTQQRGDGMDFTNKLAMFLES